jgi:hypothetical protein
MGKSFERRPLNVMSSPAQSAVFRFGEYEFNGATTKLTKHGTNIRLQGQPAACCNCRCRGLVKQ